ncbi:Rid family hydrolase [Sunxiuqinia sp. sy24]|uniref:Rid family hydrolase n=1 Tax=Sunxiuqinia sp. sy24 TaxID=3461495 RepID=UPI0040451CD8
MEEEVMVAEVVKEQNNLCYIQLVPEVGETISQFCQRLANLLEKLACRIIKATCFGSLTSREAFEIELAISIKGRFPLTWIEGQDCTGAFMNGIQIWATRGEFTCSETRFNATASCFEDEQGSYLFIGDILSELAGKPEEAYGHLLQELDLYLNENGFVFTDIIRTWYYLDDILGWYDEFNRVRTDFFNQKDVFENLVPASTGVSGRNKKGTAVTMELLAFKPKQKVASIEQVQSPLQNEAGEYGSSFSRAVKISSSACQWMSISGTASILPSGDTANIGDAQKQIAHSFEVIEQIVKQEGYSFDDVIRATAYLKDQSSYGLLQSFLDENPEYKFPLVITQNTICRGDLLFEVEMDLMK